DADLYTHYPLNSTGYYRGTWSREAKEPSGPTPFLTYAPSSPGSPRTSITGVPPGAGVYAIPPTVTNADFVTLAPPPKAKKKPAGAKPNAEDEKGKEKEAEKSTGGKSVDPLSLPLTVSHGRVALQIYSKSVPGLTSFTLLRSLVKFYDGTASTSRDVLCYAVGVHVMRNGRIKMVGNWGEGTPGLVVGGEAGEIVVSGGEKKANVEGKGASEKGASEKG
ncbi:hypothetical protein TrRE_jg1234, partial [Triparma retinervis]